MFDSQAYARLFIVLGVILIFIGAALSMGIKLPWLGKLPGDIMIKKENFTFYFPITTSIIISVLLSLVLILIRKK